MSNRRAQDERIEGTPDGVNAITEIVDVPDDVQWHLVEYDGLEHIAENHRTWD